MQGTRTVCLCAVIAVLWVGACSAAPVYPDRWVYVSRGLRSDEELAAVEQIVDTAAAHGLNGLVLEAGLDRLDQKPPEWLARLAHLRATCEARGVEIIPMVFSVGYGGAVLSHNPNLAEGLPIKGAAFEVKGDRAVLAPDPAATVANGGFEDFQENRFSGVFQDGPGTISFVDQAVCHSGKASLRFQDLAAGDKVHARVSFTVNVRPYAQYRVKVWYRTEKLDPASTLAFQAYSGDRNIAAVHPRPQPTHDWTLGQLSFNSGEATSIRLWLGTWGAREGTFWLDDISLEEEGLRCVLRRPGTPLTVTSEDGATVYTEGKDFAPVSDPRLSDFAGNHPDPSLQLLPGGRLKDGDRLRLSYYRAVTVNDGQVTVCMSEPELYEIIRTQARLIHRYLAPRRYFLSMDEIRAGGTCAACQARKLSMGEILGDCITKEVSIIREANPQAECVIWSDMLDPAHNAHGNYYVVEGDFTGSWLHVPRDLVIACWYYQKRVESLKFFSGLGFRTLAGSYYDKDDLEDPKGWLEVLDATPGAQGIMYTSWRQKYDLLGAFGDLVSKR